LCGAHRLLLDGVRGAGKQPGELRRSQNWIGGTRPGHAVFVPPPPEHVSELLSNLEQFIHDSEFGLQSWVNFFLEGVVSVAQDAESNIISVASLVDTDRKRLMQSSKSGVNSYRLFEMLPVFPQPLLP
jgi:hypothetical protein